MKKIVTEIDCGETTCGACDHCKAWLMFPRCKYFFDKDHCEIALERHDGNLLRCQQCIEAEIGGDE